MQTISPAPDYLFCQLEKVKKETKSGFLVVGAEAPNIAEIINVGNNVKGYVSGDRIVFRPYARSEIRLNENDYFLINHEDVMGKVLGVD